MTQEMNAGTRDDDIIVLGLGRAGCEVVQHIIDYKIDGVQFIFADAFLPTENILGQSGADRKIILRELEIEQLAQQKNDSFMILVADMGSAAAPKIISKIKGSGILTLCILFITSGSEASDRASVENIKQNVDALVVLERDILSQEAYKLLDDVLRQIVQGIAALLKEDGLICLDINDLSSIFSKAGRAVFGVGVSVGEDRAKQAAMNALKSPFMPASLKGFKKIMISVSTPRDITLMEITGAADAIRRAADVEADVIWGHIIDERLENSIRVAVIAAEGSDDGQDAQQQA